MRNASDNSVLFLFGRQPAESAILQAQTLRMALVARGRTVRSAGLSAWSCRRAEMRLGSAVESLGAGFFGLPLIGQVFVRRVTDTPALVYAWDLESAAVARRVVGERPRIVVVLTGRPDAGQVVRAMPALRSMEAVLCQDAGVVETLTSSGLDPAKVRPIWPMVDVSLVEAARKNRERTLASLGLAGQPGPIVVTAPGARRGSGHLEVAWGLFILRRGGVPARLVLPNAGSESSRIARFARACKEPAAVVTDREGLSWLDLLGVADVVVLPEESQVDAVLTAYALASGQVVVTRSSTGLAGKKDGALLSAETSLPSADARPLSMGRALLRACQGREVVGALVRVAFQEVARRCGPDVAVESYLPA